MYCRSPSAVDSKGGKKGPRRSCSSSGSGSSSSSPREGGATKSEGPSRFIFMLM